MQRVTSRANPRLREAARLAASARDRRKSGLCVLEGEHVVAVYAERVGAPRSLIVTDEALARPAVRALTERFSDLALVVTESLFDAIATLPPDVGVLAVIETPATRPPAQAEFCLLVEDVQDPGNVGSMLRTAAAAGAAHVLMSKHSAFAWSPKVLRAGQGAHFCVAIHEDVDLTAWASAHRGAGGEVIATVAGRGESVFDTTLRGRLAVAIGNEGSGLSASLLATATRRVTIPMDRGVESLNAAAAAAVVLFECVRQRGMARSGA
ncbi:MAG TPA: RNA methyltransferase [Casimicrobiaceae bacterium]|nr:RNA methyltransferase [Casimicrobiaceae bacterium]